MYKSRKENLHSECRISSEESPRNPPSPPSSRGSQSPRGPLRVRNTPRPPRRLRELSERCEPAGLSKLSKPAGLCAPGLPLPVGNLNVHFFAFPKIPNRSHEVSLTSGFKAFRGLFSATVILPIFSAAVLKSCACSLNKSWTRPPSPPVRMGSK